MGKPTLRSRRQNMGQPPHRHRPRIQRPTGSMEECRHTHGRGHSAVHTRAQTRLRIPHHEHVKKCRRKSNHECRTTAHGAYSMTGRFNTLNRYRVLWTDFERNRYLRELARNSEERIQRLKTQPGTPPEKLQAEELVLYETRRELQRSTRHLNDL
jgi:hypothetical protein